MPRATFVFTNTAMSWFDAAPPRPSMCTTALSLPWMALGSTEIVSAALRSHGAPGLHVISLPIATPACAESVTQDLSTVAFHGTMPEPMLEMRTVAGVDDWPGRTFTSTMFCPTESTGWLTTHRRPSRFGRGVGSLCCGFGVGMSMAEYG